MWGDAVCMSAPVPCRVWNRLGSIERRRCETRQRQASRNREQAAHLLRASYVDPVETNEEAFLVHTLALFCALDNPCDTHHNRAWLLQQSDTNKNPGQ